MYTVWCQLFEEHSYCGFYIYVDGSSIAKFALHKFCRLDKYYVIIHRRVSALFEPLCYFGSSHSHTKFSSSILADKLPKCAHLHSKVQVKCMQSKHTYLEVEKGIVRNLRR